MVALVIFSLAFLFGAGAWKGRIVGREIWRSGLETLLVGAVAAVITLRHRDGVHVRLTAPALVAGVSEADRLDHAPVDSFSALDLLDLSVLVDDMGLSDAPRTEGDHGRPEPAVDGCLSAVGTRHLRESRSRTR